MARWTALDNKPSTEPSRSSRRSRERRLAEREGFEPPCRLPGKTLSRRPRYDHFGTSPNLTGGLRPPDPFAPSLAGAPCPAPLPPSLKLRRAAEALAEAGRRTR
jgi:hypothetical protein